MTRSSGAVPVLYVDPDGLVRSGRLVPEPRREGESGPVLMSRTGRSLGPTDVLALLASGPASTDQRAALGRAAEAGYRIERT